MQGIKPSGIRVIWEKTQQIPDVVRMEIGEPDFDTPDHIKQAAKEALDQGFTHYTSSSGIPELRRAIARKMKAENNVDVNPDGEVVVTAGACNAISLAISATLDPGDEVLIPDPGWPHYGPTVRLAGGVPIGYSLLEENMFSLDVDDVRKKITNKTKMVIINTPNNPTGSVLERKTLEELADLAVEHDLFILSDEVYEKFVFDNNRHFSIASLPGMNERTITVNALSKTYAMTGWRVGYAVGREDVISEMIKINLFNNTCANSIAQKAAAAALEGPQNCIEQMVGEYKQRRDYVVKGLNEIDGVVCQKPAGAFYVFPNISGLKMPSFDAALYLLENAKVATVPGSAFGEFGENHLRLSYTTAIENIAKALERIDYAVRKLRKGE